MPFTKGKISFTPLKVLDASLPDASTIEAMILQSPYSPLPEKRRSQASFINASAEIPEEFSDQFVDACEGSSNYLVAAVVFEDRKVDMKIVNARFRREWDKRKRLKGLEISGLGDVGQTKQEVRGRIIDEEMKGARTTYRKVEFLIVPDDNLIFLATKSTNAVDRFIYRLKELLGGEDFSGEIIRNPLVNFHSVSNAKIVPFCFVEGQSGHPQDEKTYLREFLTWFFFKIIRENRENKETYGAHDMVKLCFVEHASRDTAMLKSREDEMLIEEFGAESVAEGGLVDEFKIWAHENHFGNPGSTQAKIDSFGYLSDIKVGLNKKDRATMMEHVCDGVVAFWKSIAKREVEFFKLRSSEQKWARECQVMKKIAVDYYPGVFDK